MKRFARLSLLVLLATSAFARHRGMIMGGGRHQGFVGRSFHHGFFGGGAHFRGFRSPHGFGNVVFPRVGTAPHAVSPFFFHRRGFSFVHPFGFRHPRFFHPFGFSSVVPVAFPVFVGSYAYSYPLTPNVIIIQPYSLSERRGPEIIRYGSGTQETSPRDGSDGSSTEAKVTIYYENPSQPALSRAPSYRLAFRDRTIARVLAYWAEAEKLHYITTTGTHKVVSLDMIEREFTEKLNPGRRIELPPPAMR